ncbi:Protein CLEC-41 [Aphelenchoides avenae]|nr:Protein CLEC-41 [Aphelenchus avenae]
MAVTTALAEVVEMLVASRANVFRLTLLGILYPSVLALQCADPSYTPINRNCYKFYDDPVTREEAERSCGAHADLVSISSAENNQEIAAIATDRRSDIWLGLRCSPTSNANNCTWDDATPFRYENWFTDVWFGNCAIMKYSSQSSQNTGKWMSDDCGDRKSFVCKLRTSCEPPFVKSPHDSECYHFVQTLATHDDAAVQCRDLGGKLASVHNQQTNDFLLSLAGNTTQALFNESISSIVPFPNNQYGMCVKLLTSGEDAGKWRNVRCSVRMPFVCKAADALQIGPPESGHCPRPNFFEDEGTLFSPGYPAYYGANLSCSYYLSVDDDRLVVLRFDNVLLADGDQIQLFEEDDIVPSRIITDQTTNATSEFYLSHSNLLMLKFVTSGITRRPDNEEIMGWRAFFGVADRIAGTKSVEFKLTVSPCIANQTVPPVIANGCPATEYNSFGKISSSNYPSAYGNNLNCPYQLKAADDGSVVRLWFGVFATEANYDFLNIYDGSNSNATLIAKY